MSFFPDYDTFCDLARDHQLVPVYRRLTGDLLTAVSAFHKIDSPEGACLFESVIGGEKVGRYSFLAADPYLQLSAQDHTVTITQKGRREQFSCADPLGELRRRVMSVRAAHPAELPPFIGGAVGYAGYDVVRYSENLPHPPPDDRGLPDLSFAFYDSMVIFDNVNKTMVVVAMARLEEAQGATRTAYEAACRRVNELVGRLTRADSSLREADIDLSSAAAVELDYTSNFAPADFESAVARCIEFIRAGDIFQVVLSQRLEIPVSVPPFEIYRTLRTINPSPFMFFLRTAACTLVGSSPEIMCRVYNGEVTVRPLAGTRRRGATLAEDERLAADLLADPKERAEHVMLVDLGRNDVGRVAEYGTVQLSDVMTIERYSHVMHITSNVTGRLRPGKDAFDALAACLPAGTVSGAPKVRAMQIIDQLEPHRRGPYAGAVGYFDFTGNMDTCIALRTIVLHEGRAYVQAGAGIVADSVPADEYRETLNKARGLLLAIQETRKRWRERAS